MIQVFIKERLIDESGIRSDGRRYDELRQIEIKAGVLRSADGSAYINWGGNKIIAAVYGPREVQPRYKRRLTKAIIQCKYNIASFSCSERNRSRLDRRSSEISKVMAEAFHEVVLTEKYPRAARDIFIEVLQAEGGACCAAITAASVALANAGIPMKDLLPACALGKLDGQLMLDQDREGNNFSQTDMSMAIISRTEEIVLLEMDGHLTKEEFSTGMKLLKRACLTIYELQKEALKESLTSEFTLKDTNCEKFKAMKIAPESSIEFEHHEEVSSNNSDDDQYREDEMEWVNVSLLDFPDETDSEKTIPPEDEKEEESSPEV